MYFVIRWIARIRRDELELIRFRFVTADRPFLVRVMHFFSLPEQNAVVYCRFPPHCFGCFHVTVCLCSLAEDEYRGKVEGDDRKAGVSILMRSLSAPMMQIAANAGELSDRCPHSEKYGDGSEDNKLPKKFKKFANE